MRGKASAGKCRQVVQASASKLHTQGKTRLGDMQTHKTQLNLYVRLPYAVALALGIKKWL